MLMVDEIIGAVMDSPSLRFVSMFVVVTTLLVLTRIFLDKVLQFEWSDLKRNGSGLSEDRRRLQLDLYEEEIAVNAAQKNGAVSSNSDADHAAILLEHLIMNAQTKVQILSHKFDERVYCDDYVASELVDFLDRDGSIELIVEDRSVLDNPNPMLSLLLEMSRNGEKVDVYAAPVDYGSRYDHNFQLFDCVDGNKPSFRFERNRNSVSAVAKFGGDCDEDANALRNRFNGIKDDAERVN